MSTRLSQRVLAKTSAYTLRYPMDAPGTRFTNRGAGGSVTFTLPKPTLGLIGVWYEFEIQANQTLVVAGATAGDLVTVGNASANNVSYATASNKLGRVIVAKCDGTQWVCVGLGAGFSVNGTQQTSLAAESALLQGASAGSITASKVVSRDAGSRIPFQTASPAAAGNSAGTATALSADVNNVTAADGTTGVILPTGVAGMRIEVVNAVTTAVALLKVYPDTGGTINGGAANGSFSVAPGRQAIFVCTAALTWVVAPASASLFAAGVAAGYKIARGVHQQAAASDTIASGLTTVVAVVATFRDTPTAKQTYLTTSIGDQNGAPAAGSFLSKTFKSTYAAADDFSDNLSFNWIAIGT